jgi:hypothetical protein
MKMRQAFTFKIVNLRLEFLFPRAMVTEDFYYLVVTATFKLRTRLVLLERGQQGGEVDAGYSDYMWRVLQRH